MACQIRNLVLAGEQGGEVGGLAAGDDSGQGGGGGGGDGGEAGDLVFGLAVEHVQVDRVEQLRLDLVGQVVQDVSEEGQGVQQCGVAAVLVGVLGQGGEFVFDLVAFGFQFGEGA